MDYHKLAIEKAKKEPLNFTIQYPPDREYFQDKFSKKVDLSILKDVSELLLYLHIPFCKSRCSYCNFAIDVRKDPKLYSRYINGLIRQIKNIPKLIGERTKISGIDIGGGTPTLISTKEIVKLLSALSPVRERMDHDWPLSIETTPFVAANGKEKMKALVDYGVGRCSIGIQSVSSQKIALINRTQQKSANDKALSNIKSAGFKRVNIDLIFGLPFQKSEEWQKDLEYVVRHKPDSITTYDCLYRGKSRILSTKTKGLPTPEKYGELYDLAYNYLTANDYYAPYGSVNFSRRPDETGTSVYFEGRLLRGLPYLGLGNYSSSLVANNWWFAPYGVDKFLEAIDKGDVYPIGDSYELPEEEVMAKYILSSLNFGVLDKKLFFNFFNKEIENRFEKHIQYCLDKGWLRSQNNKFIITYNSFKFLPQIRAGFYSEEAIEWLESQY